jgi:hypothetical protein
MADDLSDDPFEDLPLSAVLEDLVGRRRDIALSELIEIFGARAFGAITLVFAVACALPLPPGSSTVLGAPLVLLTPQIALGRHSPWLPRRMRAHKVGADSLNHVCRRLIPWLQRIEKVSKPRLGALFSPVGLQAMGAICAALSIVLILPIPLGNLLPAAAVAAFSLAFILRDGVLALAGFALALASTAVLVVAAHVIVRILGRVFEVVTGA